MEVLVAYYAVVAMIAWLVGLAGVVAVGLAFRELGTTYTGNLVATAFAAALFISPAYLQVLPGPKSAFVLLPTFVIALLQGPGAFVSRWPADVGFAVGVFVLIFGVGCLLRPNRSFKATVKDRDENLAFRAPSRALAQASGLSITMSQSDTDTKEELIIAPVPALVAVLLRLEQDKGELLTEAEVIAARDGAACTAMPRLAYEAVAAARGYNDIDPELAWQEWQRVRASLSTGDA